MREIGSLKQARKIIALDSKHFILKQIKCLIFLIGYSVSTVVFPSFISKIVDTGIANSDLHAIILYSIQMLICGLFTIIFYYLQRISFFKFGCELSYKIKARIYEKVQKTNVNFWNRNQAGDVFTVINEDVANFEKLLINETSGFIVNIIMIIGIGSYVMHVNYKIGIATICVSLVFAFLQNYLSNIAKAYMSEYRSTLGSVNDFTTETLFNINNIQMQGDCLKVINKFKKKYKDLIVKNYKMSKNLIWVALSGMSFNIISIFIVLIVGGIDVKNSVMSLGLLFSLTIYVQRLYSPMIGLSNTWVTFKSMHSVIDNIYKILFDTDSMIFGDKCYIDSSKTALKFDNVSFKYTKGRYILKDFSMEVMQGQMIGLVGNNGSGKTTIAKLITRLCTPTKGEIFINGLNIQEIDFFSYQKNIGYLSQDNFILKDDIVDLVNLSKTNDRFQNYLQTTNFSQTYLEKLQNSLKEEDFSTALSGGEAQKLSLYQMYLGDKDIYILDEPTSALDSESELRVIEFIKTHFKNKTLIIITHRVKILELCDNVIELGINKSDCLEDKS